MKYTFTTKFNEVVTLDRAIITGKVKVFVNGKPVASSHHGLHGATGMYYPLKGGVLEVRSSVLDIVPKAWFNDDWVDLVQPLVTWQYMLIALPFIGGAITSFGQMLGLFVGALGSLLCWILMQTQRPIKTRAILCVIIAALTPVVGTAVLIGVSMLTSGGQ
jgi:hypothetical protein